MDKGRSPVVWLIKKQGIPLRMHLLQWLERTKRTTSNALGFFQVQVDSVLNIEINSAGYPALQVKLPEASSFKIELMKAPVGELPRDAGFKIKEQMASFPNGLQSFYKYVSDNMKFPREVRNGTINGKVLVEFVVDSTGQIPPDEVKINQSLSKACDEEAIRLIKGSPRWNPGIQKDKPVNQKIILPIVFKSF
jgi:TonB family protein